MAKLLGAESKGGIIGEMAKIDSAMHTALRLQRRSGCKTWRGWTGASSRYFIGKNSEFALHVMEVMANRLRAVDKYITTQIDKSLD